MACCDCECKNEVTKLPPVPAFNVARSMILELGFKPAFEKAVRNLEITYELEKLGTPCDEKARKFIREIITLMPSIYVSIRHPITEGMQ
jgi:hypothetical protein